MSEKDDKLVRDVLDRRERAAKGRRSQAIGDAFESWVDGQHEGARRLGILAHVEHNQARSRVVKGRLIYTATGIADYTGVLVGGRTLAAEAKAVAGGRLPRSRIEEKQARHLDAVALAGGLAFLLVEFHAQSKFTAVFTRYAVPWREVPWRIVKTAESVDVGALYDEWEVQPGTCYLSPYHAGGPPVVGTFGRRRVLPRE